MIELFTNLGLFSKIKHKIQVKYIELYAFYFYFVERYQVTLSHKWKKKGGEFLENVYKIKVFINIIKNIYYKVFMPTIMPKYIQYLYYLFVNINYLCSKQTVKLNLL